MSKGESGRSARRRHVPAEAAGPGLLAGGRGGGGARGGAGRGPARPAGQSVSLRDGPACAARAADRAAVRPPLLGELAPRPPRTPLAPAARPPWPCLCLDGGARWRLRVGRGEDPGGGAAEVSGAAKSFVFAGVGAGQVGRLARRTLGPAFWLSVSRSPGGT